MATPSFLQYRQIHIRLVGLVPQEIKTRQLTCLAVLASGQNPDGTPYIP